MPLNQHTVEPEFDVYRSSIATVTPKISVILSTYNRNRREGDCESLLKRAIDSILNQTFTDFELILIDDCSVDNTKEYCQQIASRDSRVQFFHFKKNSGLPAKRYNFGISVSKGQYVTFMFDDDEWEPNALEDLYQGIAVHHKNCGMVYGLTTYYHGNDRNADFLGGEWKWSKIDTRNFIANNSVIVKRSVIDLVGGYDENPLFVRVCDWDLWWRIGRKFKVKGIDSKIGIVYSELIDSIGKTKALDWEACKINQRKPRSLPLQVIHKEPLSCKIHAAMFDLHTYLVQTLSKVQVKKTLKKVLPNCIYQLLKQMKTLLQKRIKGM